MVKSLVDILAEIEERQPVRRFQAGGMGGPDEEQGSMAGDMTPDDPGQDDTVGEEDQGSGPDITQEQSEPSDKLLQAINELYAAEDPREKDPLTLDDKDSLNLMIQQYQNLPSDAKEVTKQEYEAALKDSGKDEHEYGFFDFLIDAIKAVGIAAAPLTGGATLGLTATLGGLGTKGLGTGKEGFEVTYEPFGLAQKALEEVGAIDQPVLSAKLGEFGTPPSKEESDVAVVQGAIPGKEDLVSEIPQDSSVLMPQQDGPILTREDDNFVPAPIEEARPVVEEKETTLWEEMTNIPKGLGEAKPTNLTPNLWESGSDTSPASQIAANIVDSAVTPTEKEEIESAKMWDFNKGDAWYPTFSAKGGPIAAFSPGGLAGMMNRGMMDNQLMAQQGLQIDQQNALWNNYRSGNRPARPPHLPRPPQFGGIGLPRPSGFFDPRPPRPPQQPRLEPETYFHEHEGGKVTYPNFPKPFVNPPDDRNPIKDPKRPKPVQTLDTLNEQFTSPKLEEAPTSDSYKPLQPVPPISISETTATAMEPEAVQEATQTTIEEARPVPREIDIQMPENVTATLDFPEEVRGTANYRRGGFAGMMQHPLAKILGPLAAGYFAGPLGGLLGLKGGLQMLPAIAAGGGLGYLQGGKKRTGLDAIKGMLSAYSGAGLGRAGEAYTATKGPGQFTESFGDAPYTGTGTPPKISHGTPYEQAFADLGTKGTGYLDRIGDQTSGLWNALVTGSPDVYKGVGSALIGPASAAVGAASITPPSEMPEFTEIEVEQIKTMTPEERKQWIANRRKKYADSPLMRTQTFTPPDVDIGWEMQSAAKGGTVYPNPQAAIDQGGLGSLVMGGFINSLLQKVIAERQAQGLDIPFMKKDSPNEDIETIEQRGTFAAEGGVMEIDEEMESGSFVLPADVVSNVGDGSSDSGHRRLTELFGGGGDEYALGGGTGILKGPIKGPGSGLDDLIQTGIDGVRVARLSTDEFVVPKDVVRRLGEGSTKAGSEKLYDFMKDVRLKKHGTSEQPKEIHMSGLRKMV
jgi:hypothetical protein